MVKLETEKCSYSVQVLLSLIEWEKITTKDAGDLLYISQEHASNLLRIMWKKDWLTRKVMYKKPRGRYFEYKISQKGIKLLRWLRDEKSLSFIYKEI